MKKSLFFLVLFILFFGGLPRKLLSQSSQWNSVINISSFPSPYINDWERDPTVIGMTLFYTGSSPVRYIIQSEFTHESLGKVFKSESEEKQISSGPQTINLASYDVVYWQDIEYDRSQRERVARSGKFPEGNYRVCIKILNAVNRNLLHENCSNFQITYPNPPQLLSPANNSVVNVENPTFSWTPVFSPRDFNINYRVKIVEKLPGQTNERALLANVSHFETEVLNSNVLNYPSDALRFEDSKEYVWQVIALDQNGEPAADREGKSEIFAFRYSSSSGGGLVSFLPDTITVIPDFAFLTNLSSLSSIENPLSFVLNGTCDLILKFSESFQRRIPVNLNSFQVQKGEIITSILSGSFSGFITSFDLPDYLRSELFTPLEINFDLANGLSISGNINLPGSGSSFSGIGKLNLSRSGLEGELIFLGDDARPLYNFESELVSIKFINCRLFFSALTRPALYVNGKIKFFNEIKTIPLDDFRILPEGDFSGTLSLNEEYSIRLLPGSDRFKLNISSINGIISGNVARREFDFNLTATAGLDFQNNDTSRIGADVSFRVSGSGFNLISFSPRSNLNLNSLDLGWLKIKLNNLNLNQLTYSSSSWNFLLGMDFDIEIPQFNNLQLPRINGVNFSPSGFEIPELNLPSSVLPAFELGGFGFQITSVRLPSFRFDWANWREGINSNFNFNFNLCISFPNLPSSVSNLLKEPSINIPSSLRDGEFSFELPRSVISSDGINLPIAESIVFKVKELSGNFYANLKTIRIEPNIKAKGEIILPNVFGCEDPNANKANAELNLNGFGKLTGRVENFVPSCPYNLGFLRLQINSSSLEFSFSSENQKIELIGSGNLSLSNPSVPSFTTTASIRYEFVENRFKEFNANITTPFNLPLPPTMPALNFNISSAKINLNNLVINGRQTLNFEDGGSLGVTFDSIKINWSNFNINSGRALFDGGFGFKIFLEEGNLRFKAVRRGSELTESVGLLLELPDTIGISREGLFAKGSSSAKLKYEGYDLPSLRAVFSSNFAISFSPFKVKNGQCEIFSNSNRVAVINSDGFFPDLTFFGVAFLPERLPLPNERIAYLQIKSGETFLINYESLSEGIRISTRSGQPIKLVIPAFQFSLPSPPELNVEFSVIVDPATFSFRNGSINASIPPEKLADFDLSRFGIPLQLKDLFYGKIDGIDAFRFASNLKIFNNQFDAGEFQILLKPEGVIEGTFNISPNRTIPLINGSDKLNLIVNNASGNFRVSVNPLDLDYSLTVAGGVKLKVSDTQTYGGTVEIVLNRGIFELRNLNVDLPTTPPKIDLGFVEFDLRNFRIPSLNYSDLEGWNFELALDMGLNFKDLNFTIPNLNDIRITKAGIIFPDISIPELSIAPINLGGFGLKPLAFRMRGFTFNWFSPGSSFRKAGFAFDLELSMPELPESFPPELRNPRVTILNAGFWNGKFSGSLEPKLFTGDGLRIPFGESAGFYVKEILGSLSVDTILNKQNFDIKLRGDFQLPEFMRCSSNEIQSLTSTLNINSKGQISGVINNFIPRCPLNIGIGKINIVSSSLEFSFDASEQYIILDFSGRLKLPAQTPGDSIVANGNLRMNLLRGQIISGEIVIDRPFVFKLPSQDPILEFVINNARLNKDGLLINGSSNLNIPGGSSVRVNFNNLLLDYRDFTVKSGNANFETQFALKFLIESGGLRWSSVPLNHTITENNAVRINLPPTIGLNRNGFYANGESSVMIRYNGQEFAAARVNFVDTFSISFVPLKVSKGRANFIYNDEIIAYLDKDGFHPGNIFGVLPLPEKLPLPDTAVAYLKIKDGDRLLISTEMTDRGLRIGSRSGERITLFVPALKFSSPNVPRFDISFNVIINPSTFELVDGNISATTSAGQDALLNLIDAGIPLKITNLFYGKVGSEAKFLISGKLALPEALGNMNVNIDSIIVSRQGLSGSISVGEYSETFRSGAPVIASTNLGILQVKLQGATLTFAPGTSPNIRLSGILQTDLFKQGSDTAKIHFAAGYVDRNFNFSLDLSHLPSGKLPLGIAEFLPTTIEGAPPIDLSFRDNDFNLTINGTFNIPSFGEGFGVTVRNFRISRSGVEVPSVSINLPAAYQTFNLFGAVFTLKDVGTNKAINFEFRDRIFYLILSGEINFLNNTSTFSGFKVGSNGSISIESANLILRPFYLIENHLAITTLGVNSGNLNVAGFIRLPEPCDTTKQLFNFQVSPRGEISGGADIVAINETYGLGSGDRTEFPLWIATFDLTYAAIKLNFADIPNSSLQLIADLYLNNNTSKYVRFGNKSGGVINPGLEIKFNGIVRWGNIQTSPNLVDINWEALRLNLTNIQTVADRPDLTISVSGNFRIGVSGVGGSLSFEDIRFSKNGVERLAESIRGGSLSIIDVITIEIGNISFSDRPTTLTLRGGNAPTGTTSADTSSININVLSYFRFSGRISISGVASGGIDEFLTYRTASGNNFIIRNASLSIPNVVDFNADLKYEESAAGFYLRFAGSGLLVRTYGIRVVGKVANIDNRPSFGLFVAASVTIPIPPAIIINEIGGGFFYNPENSDLALVRRMAGLNEAASSLVTASPGSFAVLIYGSATIVERTLVSGKVLLTITENYFSLHGRVVLLNQENSLKGDIYLAIGFNNGFAEGQINIDLNVVDLIEGKGGLEFYVYGSDAWGIKGNFEAKIIKILDTKTKLFIGNPGFVLDMKVELGFDIWIIKVGAGFEGTMWYVRNVSWGAYCKAWVEASVLAGVVAAKGWLEGALIGEPNFFIYGVAGLKISVLFASWEGSVWAKISQSGLDGGFGRDSEMEKLIQEAKQSAEEMQEARDQAQQALENARYNAFSLTDEQLSQAFNTLFYAGQMLRSNNLIVTILGAIILASVSHVEKDNGGVTADFENMMNFIINNFWSASDAPSLQRRNLIRNLRNNIDQRIAQLNQSNREFAANLSQIQASISELTSRDYVLNGNPMTNLRFESPIATEYTGSDGKIYKRVASQPGFNFDQAKAIQNVNTISQAQNDFADISRQIRDKISALTNAIATVDQAIYNSNPNINSVGQNYRNLYAAIDDFYKERINYLRDEINWANSKLSLLQSQRNYIANQILLKNNRIGNDWDVKKQLTWKRYEMILMLSGNNQDLTAQRNEFYNNWNSLSNDKKNQRAYDMGMALWHNTNDVGLRKLDSTARAQIAESFVSLNQDRNNLNNSQEAATEAINNIFVARIKLIENTYDIYNRYKYWKQEQPDSIRNAYPSLTFINNKLNYYSNMLKVPIINSVTATATNMGYYNNVSLRWIASHPGYFMIRENKFLLRTGTYNNIFSYTLNSMQTIGNVRNINFITIKNPAAISTNYTAFVGVRAGAGYMNARLIQFTSSFTVDGNPTGSSSTFNMQNDNSPPITPTVTFHRYKSKSLVITNPFIGTITYRAAFSSSLNSIEVSWQSIDLQSGIIDYEYSIGSNPGSTDILNWTSAGGRTEAIILGLNLNDRQTCYVNVRATNGAGLISPVGSSIPLIIDATPPSSPGKDNSLIFFFPNPIVSSTPSVNPIIELPAELQNSGSSVNLSSSYSWGFGSGISGTTGLISSIFVSSSGLRPKISIKITAANDAQSGIFGYEYLIYDKNNPSRISESWKFVGDSLSFNATDNILNYRDSFMVEVRAINYAGLPSESLVLGPFVPIDPTPPSKPEINLAYGRNNGNVYIIFSQLSSDPETDIAGYQLAIGTAPGSTNIKNWGDIDIYRNQIGAANSFLIPNYSLSSGRYYVSVRSKNNQGKTSQMSVSGIYYVDRTPPSVPVANVIINSNKEIIFVFSNYSDPESGIKSIEYSIEDPATNTKVSNWIGIAPSWFGTTTTTSAFGRASFPWVKNKTYVLKVRTVNKANLISQIFTTNFTTPEWN